MKRYKIIKILIIIFYVVVLIRIYDIGYLHQEYYENLYDEINANYIYTRSAPRGRIIDRNGNIIVDNKGIREVIYRKLEGISTQDEIEIAYQLSNILSMDKIKVSDDDKKSYYYIKYKTSVEELIDDKVKEDYQNRFINYEEYMKHIYNSITTDMLKDIDEKEVYIYNLMNDGYLSHDKLLKSDISNEEYTLINELGLSGIRCDIYYERIYNYDSYFNQILGSIGSIPKEERYNYLDKGYELNDTVGISFLEEYYEEYLRGEKGRYKVNDDNSLTLVSEMQSGNDLILSIDMDIQLKVEKLLVNEVKKAKKVFSSKYYNGSYIVVSNPNDGGILAMIGLSYNKGNITSDVVGLLTNSYTVGSVVKGAGHTVAYVNGVLDEKTKINDGCVKLYSQKPKCSWKYLGRLNDINALAYSSNYFQYVNAIKVSGKTYRYNMKFNPTEADFNKYRDIYASYGLGSLTGIDIQDESKGIKGSTISGDLLLNLSIGQYDTYTPVQLNQYISTLANGGTRYKLRIVSHGIDNNGNIIEVNKKEILNKVDIDKKYMNRIKTGLESVIKYGTGSSYIRVTSGAGKTGTSETFYNGKSTITQSFIGYAPADNPEYAYVIISPHIGYENNVSNYQYPINSRLSRGITNILFEK